ncbi:hypothetical protein HYPSUDRAFT_960210 [Hypholoma sublateritium FD-334 SS-4]|uniref:Uncharacterized protein n=1 Tax=Hypholoma sublateritium (strain FD-334 SS-4) TaxID=945553 RepID=A0A0D2NNH3_HYPSF|nr:hypothetical protein HYPSUDRAFT_960210 [Hypholoma sublateritium FD-334 SS-4]
MLTECGVREGGESSSGGGVPTKVGQIADWLYVSGFTDRVVALVAVSQCQPISIVGGVILVSGRTMRLRRDFARSNSGERCDGIKYMSRTPTSERFKSRDDICCVVRERRGVSNCLH